MGNDATLQIRGDNGQLIAALGEAKAAVSASFAQMAESAASVKGAFEGIAKAAAMFTAVLAGGSVLKESIKATQDWGEGAIRTGKSLGITTEQASVYNVALQHLGISTDVLSTASAALTRQIHSGGGAFEKLGVNARDTATGGFRAIGDIMEDVNAKLLAMPNVTQRNVAGLAIYGRAWSEVKILLRLTQEEMEAAKARAEQLHLVVGPDGVAKTHAYKEALNDTKLVMTSLQIQIGQALLPSLTQLGSAFSDMGPEIGEVFGNVLKGIAYIAGTVFIQFEKLGKGLGALAAAGGALLHGDIAGAKAIMNDLGQDVDRLNKKADTLWDNLNRPIPAAKSKPIDLGGGGDDFEKDKNRVPQWETELKEKAVAFQADAAQQGQLREFSKQQEVQYWRDILSTTTTSLAERKSIREKMAQAELAVDKERIAASVAGMKLEEDQAGKNAEAKLAIAQANLSKYQTIYGTESAQYAEAQRHIVDLTRQAEEQKRQIEDIGLKAAADKQLSQIQLEEQMAEEKYSIGAISIQRLVALEKQFEDEKFSIHQAALQRELALIDPMKDPVAYRQLTAQIEAIENQHQQAMLKIDQKTNQQQIKLAKSLQETLSNGMSQAIQGIINKTETLGQAFRNIFSSMLNVVIGSLTQMAAAQLTQHLVAMTQNKQEASSNAAVAATGGAKSAAQIPYIGWLLAIGAAAAIFAAASSYKAEGGFDVPSGLSPNTQLHPREMVLPAHLADRVRAITPDASGGGGGGSGGGLNLHVKTNDARSFLKSLNRGGALHKALRDLHRRTSTRR